jgi:hypothetical protein
MLESSNPSCPLVASEQRLSDCLTLWSEAKSNYFNPNSFRLSLNNCIQTLRNTTWILQKTKSKFNNFDNWYNNWRNQIEKDTIMSWLIQARNIIVKQGDLATSSRLRIAIIETWLASPSLEIDLDPSVETKNFIKSLAKNKPDNIDLRVGLLRAERRWIDEQLEGYELLEALSHVYTALSDLLIDAHEKLIYKENLLACPWYTQHKHIEGQLPDCMKIQEWDRTIWLDLNTGQTLEQVDIPIKIIDKKEVDKHYPDMNREITILKKSTAPKKSELEAIADYSFEVAKIILKTDGFHCPMAHLGYSDGHMDLLTLDIHDRTEKHLAIRKVASDVEKRNATFVLLINEVWVSNTNDYHLTPSGVESPTLREALQIIAANAKGETYIKQAYFKRDKNGKIKIGKEFELSDEFVNILEPIREVWRKTYFSK